MIHVLTKPKNKCFKKYPIKWSVTALLRWYSGLMSLPYAITRTMRKVATKDTISLQNEIHRIIQYIFLYNVFFAFFYFAKRYNMHKLHVHVCPILCQTSYFLKFTKNDRRKIEKNKTKTDRPYFVTNCS